MKIEKLNDNKIIITLNKKDLINKKIDIKSLIKNTDQAQYLFKSLLKKAEKEIGFIVDDEKLLIEAYFSKDGFFIITFTKFHLIKKANSINKTTKNIKKNISISKKTIFLFNNFNEFCDFCTYFNNFFNKKNYFISKQIILYEYKTKYYLVLSENQRTNELSSLFYLIISEFAQNINNSPFFENKLIERGKIVFKHNAIKNGFKYFS